MFPEIIFLAETEDTFRSNTDFFVPDIKGFIIILIDRRIQTILIKSDNLCQEFP